MRTIGSPIELESLWRDLEVRSVCQFFLSWDWIGCWIAEIGVPVQVVIGRSAGRIVLLGVLVSSVRRGRVPFTFHSAGLHVTGDPQQDVITIEYNGFLVARDFNPMAGSRANATAWAEDAAINFLLRDKPAQDKHPARRIDELHLRNVSSLYEEVLAPATTHECQPIYAPALREKVWSKPSWRVDLQALRTSDQTYMDSLSANTRQQIRRSMRLYEKQGPLGITRARDVPEALAFLDELKALHQPYWISRGEPGAFAYPFFERFQRRLIETCHPHGAVELIRVTRGDTPIGYLYNLVYRGQVYSYQSGFRFEDDSKLKPGLVSHCLCIQLHEREGARVYDFMAGENRYKSNLGSPGPDMHYVLLQRATPKTRLESGLRHLRNRLRSAIGRS